MPRRKRKHTWKSVAAERLLQLTGYPPTVEDAIRLVGEEWTSSHHTGPISLEHIAQQIHYSKPFQLGPPEEDLLHDDGLRFFEQGGISSREYRWEYALSLAHHFFASMKPRGLTKGVELERLCRMLASEFLLPTRAFRMAMGSSLSLSGIYAISTQFDVHIRIVAQRLMGIPYTAIFEVDHERIIWGYGGIRMGSIHQQEPEMQMLIQRVQQEKFEHPIHFFSPKRPWFGSRSVEWSPSQIGKTVVLIRLARREESFPPQNEDFSPSPKRNL